MNFIALVLRYESIDLICENRIDVTCEQETKTVKEDGYQRKYYAKSKKYKIANTYINKLEF